MPEEPKKRDGKSCVGDDVREKARDLFADWRTWVSEGLTQVETFTKEKPATGLALSFLTGFLISALFRRKS
ncbi:MAG: hypothetical protein AAB074_16720 [Planctomycetota bacterium]